MKKLLLTGFIISGLVMASPAVVSACPAKGKSECSKCSEKAKKCKVTKLKKKTKLLWENKEDLGVKDSQLEKIKDIKHAAIKGLIQAKADKELVMVDLKFAMYEDVWDLGEINKLISAKYAAKEESAKVFVKAIADIQKILSKDQRSQWKELIKKACAECAGKGGKICPLAGKTK